MSEPATPDPREDERSPRDPELLTQTAARLLAARLNAEGSAVPGMANVAHAVPTGSWGGRERGWTVSLVPEPRP